MIKILNLVDPGSDVYGWRVIIDKDNDPKYRIKLEGSKAWIGLNIDDKSYMDLTSAAGVDQFAPCKLIAHVANDGSLIPSAALATFDTDINIILLNFETNIGEIITNVELVNCEAIAHYIGSDNFKASITMSLIAINPLEPSTAKISYGYNGGKSLSTKAITFDGRERVNTSPITMAISQDKVDLIEPTTILLPKFDLNTVVVTEES